MPLPQFAVLNECPVCKDGCFIPKYKEIEDRIFGSKIVTNISACQSCGCLFQNPQITPDSIALAYETYYTHQRPSKDAEPSVAGKVGFNPKLKSMVKSIKPFYRLAVTFFHLRKLSPEHFAAYQYGYIKFIPVLERFFSLSPFARETGGSALMFLKPVQDGKILDFGCGNGEFLKRMFELGWNSIGVEADPKACEYARESNPKMTILEGGIEKLASFPESQFDAVTLSHVIEHVHFPLKLVQESLRILKPGGRLIILTPNVESRSHKRFGKFWRGLEPPRHLILFTKSSMQKILKDCTFSKVEITTSGELTPYIWSLSQEISQGQFYFSRTPRLKFRVLAFFAYYRLWLISLVQPQNKSWDTLKIIITK